MEKKLCCSILLALVVVNSAWVIVSLHSGSIIGLTVYGVVAYLCWYRNHFQAGIIAGIIGLGIHIYEIISWGMKGLRVFECGLLIANLILPVVLIYFSYRANRIRIGKPDSV